MDVARANDTAREATLNAAEIKSMLDTFMDATGVSAGNQKLRAVHAKDGRVTFCYCNGRYGVNAVYFIVYIGVILYV